MISYKLLKSFPPKHMSRIYENLALGQGGIVIRLTLVPSSVYLSVCPSVSCDSFYNIHPRFTIL